MNKFFTTLIALFFFVSCSQSKRELYKITDSFVESLYTKYDAYGIPAEEYLKKTTDGKYRVLPMGRLINVSIMEVVEDDIYEELRDDLQNHYNDDERVHNVYINNSGTIMIDCRN